jgi:D-alanine--poly(phosphoribitol) ligase subunit 2
MDEITQKVKQFIVDEFMPDVPVEELDADFDLLAGGVVDSLGLL